MRNHIPKKLKYRFLSTDRYQGQDMDFSVLWPQHYPVSPTLVVRKTTVTLLHHNNYCDYVPPKGCQTVSWALYTYHSSSPHGNVQRGYITPISQLRKRGTILVNEAVIQIPVHSLDKH